MAVTFKSYLKQAYDASPRLKRYYGSFSAYFESKSTMGFGQWLEANRGESFSYNETVSLVNTYMTIGKRTVADIPTILSSLMRQYEIEVPVIEGILTAEYWAERIQVRTR